MAQTYGLKKTVILANTLSKGHITLMTFSTPVLYLQRQLLLEDFMTLVTFWWGKIKVSRETFPNEPTLF